MSATKETFRVKIIATAVVAAIMVTSASAQSDSKSKSDAPPSGQAATPAPRVLTFADFDVDKNEVIMFNETEAYWKAIRRQKFDRYDTDADGKISREEWQRWQNASKMYRPGRDGGLTVTVVTWDDLDRDKDGAITFTEYQNFWDTEGQRVFKRFDTNADGKISREEWAVWEKTAPMRN